MLKPILLVEDNPKDLELTLIALERSQLANEVVVVRDGAEALDCLFRRGDFAHWLGDNPAVILLDLKLPKVDGLEVLKTVRESPELRSIPIVMLTSSSEEPDLSRAYQLGVNAYVVKPVEFRDFVAAIAELGIFWAVLNEPPPGSARMRVIGQRTRRPRGTGSADE
ncbi:response regulator [Chitinolyticbacter meiyuanensis]|uniref:response regulator n=1 Tax=Chitinolyticbacter meiyuanensis TaxID=682798 RepID=UPI0011E58DAF|nr:response regulator [Chitinolyticbacter meiyuanensis]